MGGHPNAEQKQLIEAGVEAERQFRDYLPEYLRVLKGVYVEMRRRRTANGGVLDPELAVQLWYRVDAEFELERRFSKKVTRGAAVAKQVVETPPE